VRIEKSISTVRPFGNPAHRLKAERRVTEDFKDTNGDSRKKFRSIGVLLCVLFLTVSLQKKHIVHLVRTFVVC